MRPSAPQPLLGVLLCLLLALDAVGAAAAAVRNLGGGCAHAQTTSGAGAMAASGHDAHGAMQGSHSAPDFAGSHANEHPGHGAQAHDAQVHHGHLAVTGEAQDSAPADLAAAAPADDCRCDDGSCACPAACSLALTAHACPTLGARVPDDMTAGLAQHARPAPPQPDTLRPPIG